MIHKYQFPIKNLRFQTHHKIFANLSYVNNNPATNTSELWRVFFNQNFRKSLISTYLINNENITEDHEEFNTMVFKMDINHSKNSKQISSLSKNAALPKDFEKSIQKNFSFYCTILIANLKTDSERSVEDLYNLGCLLSNIMKYDKTFELKNFKICLKKVLILQIKNEKNLHEFLEKHTMKQKIDIIEWMIFPNTEVQLLKIYIGSFFENVISIHKIKQPQEELFLIIEKLFKMDIKTTKLVLSEKGSQATNVVLLLKEMYNDQNVLNMDQLLKILEFIKKTSVFINKEYIVKLTENIHKKMIEDYNPSIFSTKHFIKYLQIFTDITQVENIYSTKLYTVNELDDFYEWIINCLWNHKQFLTKSPKILAKFASSLQRSNYYDENFVIFLANTYITMPTYSENQSEEADHYTILNQKLKELSYKLSYEKDQEITKEILIRITKIKAKLFQQSGIINKQENSFKYFANIAHCFARNKQAFLNQKDNTILKDFLMYSQAYIQNFVKAQSSKNVYDINSFEICKTLWALCVISENPEDILPHYKILMRIIIEGKFFFQQDYRKFQVESEIKQIYLAHIYMKKTIMLDQIFVDNMIKVLEQYELNKVRDVSMLHLEVCKFVEEQKISYKIEDRLEHLEVDIILGDFIQDYNIVIDIHGYQHYFRNTEVLKGNNLFKRYLITKIIGYKYFEVPVFVWQSLLDEESKQEYMRNNISLYLDSKI